MKRAYFCAGRMATPQTHGLEGSGREHASVALPSTGNYEVIVRMAGFGGSYEVSYGLR